MAIDPVSLAITVALQAATMAITASQHITGPRVSDLSVTVADYGTPMNYFRGTRRLELPVFYAEPIQERKKKRKTKGGKYKEFTYYGTFAALIADHDITSVDRVWFDRHLVFDRLAGTNIFELVDGYELAAFMRIYYGTEDQDPDDRMLATVEAEEGAGTCPAYLGIAYLFFEDIPLEKLGNRFPQISCEASRGGGTGGGGLTADVLSETIHYPDNDFYGPAYQPSGSFFFSPSERYGAPRDTGDSGYLVDFETPALVYRTVYDNTAYTYLATPYADTFIPHAVDDAGSIWGDMVGVGHLLELLPADPLTPIVRGTWTDPQSYTNWIRAFTLPNGSTLIVACPAFSGALGYWRYVTHVKGSGVTTTVSVLAATGRNWQPASPFQDSNGDVWITGTNELGGGQSTAFFYRITDVTGSSPFAAFQTFTGLPDPGAYDAHFLRGFERDGFFVGAWMGTITNAYLIDQLVRIDLSGPGTVTLQAIVGDWYFGDYGDAVSGYGGSRLIPPGTDVFYINAGNAYTDPARLFQQVDAETLAFLDQHDLDEWALSADFGAGDTYLYNLSAFVSWEVISDFVAEVITGILRIYRLDETDPVTLGSICRDVALLAGMSDTDFDFDDLDQSIAGYSWTQGPAREIVAPLVDIYDSDIRPHGFTQQGVKRGQGLSGSSILTEWLVRDGDQPLYRTPIAGDSDLPRRIFAVFADLDAEQQSNTAVAQRNAASVATVRELSIDITTLALTASDAQALVERRLRRAWIGAVTIESTVTPVELGLEPADVRNLVLDGETVRARLTKMTIRANRAIETRWEQDGASVATIIASPGAAAAGRPDPVVYSAVASQGFVLDIPLLSDTHDQTTPFVYVAAAPAEDGSWPGTDFWQSDSGATDSYASGWDGVGSGEEVTWGTAESILPDAFSTTIDEGSELVVQLFAGTLESVTEAELIANEELNLALIGSELIQFRDATLESGGLYTVRGLIRGVRGTEQHIATHVADEDFILFSSVVHRHDMGASEIGDTDYYKPATPGFNVDSDDPIVVEFTAAANRPLSPVHIELEKDGGSGDWSIAWTRRTRIGGATLNGQDVPLGETSEAYRVRILDEEGDAVRTIESTIDSATYTQAQQVVDWGSGQSTLSVEIVQMSPALSLEGFAARASA